jgi:hypothetical protein
LQDLQQQEISAQKRYKLQLQAEINKLKEKYTVHLPNQKSIGPKDTNQEAMQMLLTPKSTKPNETQVTMANEATP